MLLLCIVTVNASVQLWPNRPCESSGCKMTQVICRYLLVFCNFPLAVCGTLLLQILIKTWIKCSRRFTVNLIEWSIKNVSLKTLSGCKAKRFSKPCFTRGIRRSIKIKNKLFLSGNTEKYQLYRNHILTLTRLSKNCTFTSTDETNLLSIKKTWEGINSLLNRGRNRKSASKIKTPDNSGFTRDPSQIANILNSHFTSIGHKLASKLPQSSHHLADYYHQTSFLSSVFFLPVTNYEVQLEIFPYRTTKHMVYIRV